jgi:hypothetical protein
MEKLGLELDNRIPRSRLRGAIIGEEPRIAAPVFLRKARTR